jgi:hypothetical protein
LKRKILSFSFPCRLDRKNHLIQKTGFDTQKINVVSYSTNPGVKVEQL